MTMNTLPDTQLVKEATRFAQGALTLPLLYHSQRVFLLGRAYAEARSVSFEEEDLLLAALFHDLGLSDALANPKKAFTEIGGDLILDLLTQHGDPARGRLLAEAIDFHMQLLPRWSKGPVVGLLQVGAWMDASGRRSRSVGVDRIAAVKEQYPRGEFEPEFRRRLRKSFGSFRACVRLVLPRAR